MAGKRKKAGAAAAALLLAVSVAASPVGAVQYTGTESYMSGKYYQALREVSLTGDGRRDMVTIAQSQLGYQEGGSPNQLSGQVYGGVNHTEYGAWYGVQDMWCAMFVSWCAEVAGVPETVIPRHAFTPNGLQWFAERGRAYSRDEVAAGQYTPKAGDLVYFKSSRNNRTTNHVGLVTGYGDGRLYTVEGNVGAAGIPTNGGAVVDKSYPISNTFIVYVCEPDYQEMGMSRCPEEKDPVEQRLKTLFTTGETGGVLGYGTVTGQRGLTLGLGQWGGGEALMLLKEIRRKDPREFGRMDTAGIGAWLEADKLPAAVTAQTVDCLERILTSHMGVQAQEEKMEASIAQALELARDWGDPRSAMLCGVLIHLGGSGTARRCVEQAREQEMTLPEALEQMSPELYRSCERLLSMEDLYA